MSEYTDYLKQIRDKTDIDSEQWDAINGAMHELDDRRVENEMLKGRAADKFVHAKGCKEPIMSATCLSCEDIKWAQFFADETALREENERLRERVRELEGTIRKSVKGYDDGCGCGSHDIINELEALTGKE